MKPNVMLVIIQLSVSVLACEKDDVGSQSEEVNLRVNYYTEACTGEAPQQCLLVQEGSLIGTEEWTFFYDHIEGFSYESGFVYDLVVRKSDVKNPPADGSSIRYQLVKVVSKERKTS